MKGITETFDRETGKLGAPYQLKGMTSQIDEGPLWRRVPI